MNKKQLVDHCMDVVELLALRTDRLQRLIELGTPQEIYQDEVQMVKDTAQHIISITNKL